jgi:hypothetical protein
LATAPVQGQAPVTAGRPSTAKVGRFGTNEHQLRVDRDGTLRVRLVWTERRVDLDLYLVEASCTDLYSGAGCGILGSAAGTTSGQETLSRSVREGERMLVLVDNLHPTQSAKYRLELEWIPSEP